MIHDHQLKYATTDPEGGAYITKDISIVLNTSMTSAEKIKRDYGYADSLQASADNEFPVDVVGQSEPTYIDERYLAEIIEARLSQIFDRIKDRLNQIQALDLPGGIVLTGGVAALPGIAELAADQFNTNVRVYIPDQMGLRHPSFTAALSLVSYFADLPDVDMIVRSAVGATLTKVPKLASSQDSQIPVSEKSTKPKRQTQKKKRGEGIKNFFSDFFD